MAQRFRVTGAMTAVLHKVITALAAQGAVESTRVDFDDAWAAPV